MPGGYQRHGPFEVVTNTRVGHYLDVPINDEDTHLVCYGYDGRSDTLQSDFHHPTTYGREVVHVIDDTPSVYLREDIDGTWVKERIVSTTHISTGVGDPALWSYPSGYLSSLQNAEDRSITLARDRLRQKDSFSIGVAIAEARSTASMLADTGGNMARALISLRRHASSLSRGRDLVLATGGAWLEGYYGWGQLARDTFDLKARLDREVSEPLLIKSSAKSSIVKSYDSDETYREQSKWEGLAKVGYTASLDDEFTRSLEGWGLINPLSVAWESVPYSFCLDWIVPVGNTLSSLTATAGLKFEHGYLSRVSSFDSELTGLDNLSSAQMISPGHYHRKMKLLHRTQLHGFQLPRLYANENPFSTNRILSGLALISQAVLGR